MSDLKKDIERGITATQYYFLSMALILTVLFFYAIAGVTGAIITTAIISAVIYAVRTGKLKLY